MIEIAEPVTEAPQRPRIETVREALRKVGAMLQQEWYFEEVAEALASGLHHESRLVCRESANGFVVALARTTKSKSTDKSFIRLDLE
jgi:hypothetical protein